MKKTLSIFIILVIILSSLTGCSQNTFGYLELMTEIYNLKEFSFENNTTIKYADKYDYKLYDMDIKSKGKVNLTDPNSIYLDIELDVLYKNNKTKNPIKIIHKNNNTYIEKTSIIEIAYILDELSENDKIYTTIANEILSNDLKNIEYIEVSNFKDLLELDTDFNFINKLLFEVYNQEFIDLLKNNFNKFDEKIILRENNGYTLDLNSKNFIEFMKTMINYLNNNKTSLDNFGNIIKKAYINYLIDDGNINNYDYNDYIEMSSFINDYDITEEIYYSISEIENYLLENEDICNFYEYIYRNSSFKQSVYKENNVFTNIIDFEFDLDDISITFIEKSTITPSLVEESNIPNQIIDYQDFHNIYNKIYSKINPVVYGYLNWNNESDYASLYYERKNGIYDYSYENIIKSNNNIYIHKNLVETIINDTIQIDNKNNSATIIKNNNEIKLDSILENDDIMINISCFDLVGIKTHIEKYDGYYGDDSDYTQTYLYLYEDTEHQ